MKTMLLIASTLAAALAGLRVLISVNADRRASRIERQLSQLDSGTAGNAGRPPE
jgi:hypothetical protein